MMSVFPAYDESASLVGILPEITRIADEQKGIPLPEPEVGVFTKANPGDWASTCSICKTWLGDANIENHQARFMVLHSRVCDFCKIALPTVEKRHDHMNQYHGFLEYKTYFCPDCPYQTALSGYFDDHYKAAHGKDIVCGIFRCPDKFTNKRLRELHRRQDGHEARQIAGVPIMRPDHDPKKSLVGVMPDLHNCGEFNIDTRPSKVQHIWIKPHSKKRSAEYKKGWNETWECNICFGQFATEAEGKYHEENYLTEHDLRCTICKITFSNPYHALEHRKIYHDQTLRLKYKCKICPYQNEHLSTIDEHLIRYHQIGTKNCWCPFDGCNARCENKTERSEHMTNCAFRTK